jgi:predicted nucleic acid-binding protein
MPQDIHTYLQQNRKCNSKYGGKIIIQQAVTTTSRINLHTILPYHSINLPATQATVDSTKNNITKKRQYTKTNTKHQHLALREVLKHPALLQARNLEACQLVIPIFNGPTVMSA